ncbi:MAG: ribokinase [Chloroflexi bacterium]|nr:ribokinase [Chloroflexota bacterium]
MTRIIVVGSANMDLVVQTPHIPGPGETVLGRNFVMALGGKGANQAVGAARLGADVVFVARVGQDTFGDQCLDGYRDEGITVDYVFRDPDAATGVGMIAVADDGENSITVASGANMRLTPQDVETARGAFAGADVLLLQLEVPLETVLAAALVAREQGLRVVLNPAPAQEIPDEILAAVDVITPNRVEAAGLMGISDTEVQALSDENLAKGVLGLGPSEAVITLGAQGALVAGSWGWTRVAAFPVTPVDTTAAGDAFNAGLAVALARGTMALDQAARYASACGALAATKLGAQPSLPAAAAVVRLLGEE